MSEQNGAEKELQPTPASEFREVREQGVLQQLPTGRVVRMRNVTPEHLLRQGEIPDVLTTLALKAFYGQLEQQEMWDFVTAPQEERQKALDTIESLRAVCTAALLYPRIADEPQSDDEIQIEDLTPTERGWVFMLAFQEAEALSRFRYEPPTDVEGVPDDAGNKQQAEPAS